MAAGGARRGAGRPRADDKAASLTVRLHRADRAYLAGLTDEHEVSAASAVRALIRFAAEESRRSPAVRRRLDAQIRDSTAPKKIR